MILDYELKLCKASWERVTGVKFCTSHTAKMKGIHSLSTWKGDNKYCRAYSKNKKNICYYCYVEGLAKFYGRQFVEKYKRNSEILKKQLLKVHLDLSRCKQKYYRFESFGDLSSMKQVMNYFQICYDNPTKRFALWTKNPWIIEWVIKEKGWGKPKNLNIIYSSRQLNKCDLRIFEKYDFIDKIFTVYDKNYIKKHHIEINCGARDCATCLKCYEENDIRIINEELK